MQRISSESLQLWSGRGIIEFSHQGGAVYGDYRSGTLVTADPSTGASGGMLKLFTSCKNTGTVLEKYIFFYL